MPVRIPAYWAKAECREGRDQVCVNGWSDRSAEEALENARSRARRVLDIVRAGGTPGQYEYGAGPLREPVLERVTHEGREIAVLSRNRYGAVVLNTDGVLFADVDFRPFSAGGILNALALLFNPGRKRRLVERQRQEETARVVLWGREHPEHPFRLYRTCAGLRLLFTGRTYDPGDPGTIALLESVGSDPLYVRLTRRQSCFRARLTPKPWRLGLGQPPAAFPFLGEEDAERYRRWLARYEEAGARFRCCDLLREEEGRIGDAAIRRVVDLHDRRTGATSRELPLA